LSNRAGGGILEIVFRALNLAEQNFRENVTSTGDGKEKV
jgi:hypothetical protein